MFQGVHGIPFEGLGGCKRQATKRRKGTSKKGATSKKGGPSKRSRQRKSTEKFNF
jgi:hypothetical protein